MSKLTEKDLKNLVEEYFPNNSEGLKKVITQTAGSLYSRLLFSKRIYNYLFPDKEPSSDELLEFYSYFLAEEKIQSLMVNMSNIVDAKPDLTSLLKFHSKDSN